MLLEVIHDDTRLPHVTKAALDAFIHTTAQSENGAIGLQEILSDIDNRTIVDPDNELLASLLTALYPGEIPPSEIWKYLTEEGQSGPLRIIFCVLGIPASGAVVRSAYCGAS